MNKMGFLGYHLIVYDYVNWAKDISTPNSTESNKAIIRESKGKKQLLLPLAGLKEISYQLIF